MLPDKDKKARELILSKSQYALLDGVLYKLEKDNSLRIFVTECDGEELLKEAHEGVFGGHLREAKIYCILTTQ